MTVVYDSAGIVVHHGDNLDVLAGMPDNSIDAVCTDPPYGLEFMGREWDRLDAGLPQEQVWKGRRGQGGASIRDDESKPGSRHGVSYGVQRHGFKRCTRCNRRAFSGTPCTCDDPQWVIEYNQGPPSAAVRMQRWHEQWAHAVYRVLKPGGYVLSFGGTRTYHRLACGIEDAGFEIRDTLAWLYGCLTDDAEILTDTGWKPGIEVRPGERVAQWDHATDAITLAPVEDVYRAPWDGPMRVLRNADTDQLLTPNHRVYHRPRRRQQTQGVRRVWYDNAWQVAEASDLSKWNPVQLPIAGVHDGPGVGGVDYAALLGWVWTEGGFDLSGTGVRIYQSSTNADHVAAIAALMDRMGPHKRYDRDRTYRGRVYTETTWFFTGELAARVRADLPGKRPTYPLLWQMTADEKRAMLHAAMLGDGSGWGTSSQQFYQQHEDDLVWMQTLLALIGRAGKVGMRPNRPGGAVYLRDRATTELQRRHLQDSSERYQGEVWCVKVPTGAFVARRNGRVFITGNSGFPKSLDVGKAIDQLHGAEREVVGVGGRSGKVRNAMAGDFAGSWDATAPATDDAQRWDGWGTALKPAHEPIVVARKPLAGTVAANVLAHGTGGINIDGCRIGNGGHLKWSKPRDMGYHGGTDIDGSEATTNDKGRWPANVVLDEHAAALLDGQAGDAGGGYGVSGGDPDGRGIYGGGFPRGDLRTVGYGDHGGPSRFFYCPKASSADRGPGNDHETVKPVELMRWLVRLVTPPDGVVLDLFAGSGTTAVAAAIENRRAVVIEKEPCGGCKGGCRDYVSIIRRRLEQPIQPVLM